MSVMLLMNRPLIYIVLNSECPDVPNEWVPLIYIVLYS